MKKSELNTPWFDRNRKMVTEEVTQCSFSWLEGIVTLISQSSSSIVDANKPCTRSQNLA